MGFKTNLVSFWRTKTWRRRGEEEKREEEEEEEKKKRRRGEAKPKRYGTTWNLKVLYEFPCLYSY